MSNTKTKIVNFLDEIDIRLTFGNYVVASIAELLIKQDTNTGKLEGQIVFIQFDEYPISIELKESHGILPGLELHVVWQNRGSIHYAKIGNVQVLDNNKPCHCDNIVGERVYDIVSTKSSSMPYIPICPIDSLPPNKTKLRYINIPSDNEHDGMIYNEYTERWVWL